LAIAQSRREDDRDDVAKGAGYAGEGKAERLLGISIAAPVSRDTPAAMRRRFSSARTS